MAQIIGDPFVSIIVPVYNAEKYLERCLDSLVGQTLSKIEILCVNDGSTDSSLEILNRYAAEDSRIIVFHQDNKGPGSARNTALENVKGKYILFCDADDTLERDACLECYILMEEAHVDIIIFNTNIIEAGRKTTAWNKELKDSSGSYKYLVHQNNNEKLNQAGCIKTATLANVWGYCFRSDLIQHFRLLFTQYRIGEDTLFLISYLLTIKSGWALDKVFYNYYLYKGAASDNTSRNHIWWHRFIYSFKLINNIVRYLLKYKMLSKIVLVFHWLFALWRFRTSSLS